MSVIHVFVLQEQCHLKRGEVKQTVFFSYYRSLLISLERALGGFRANKQRLHAIHVSTTDENRPRLLVH